MKFAALVVLWTFSWRSEGNTLNGSLRPEDSSSPSVLQKPNEPIDEAFLQHKDVLLEMLEAKLKELREKKKKKQGSDSASQRCSVGAGVELRLNARGLSVVGDADADIRLTSDNSSLTMEASGVAAVGRARMTLNGPHAPHVPGLGQLFSGDHAAGGDCVTQSKVTENTENKEKSPMVSNAAEFRRHANITKSESSSSKTTQKLTSRSEATTPFETKADNYYPE